MVNEQLTMGESRKEMRERKVARFSLRHGRVCPGHPRLSNRNTAKAWMPGSSPGMTTVSAEGRSNQLFKNSPAL
jgi:hypothetical protein